MRLISAAEVDAALSFPLLVDALADAFKGGYVAPPRHHQVIERPGGASATQLLMPAWTTRGDYLGVKIVNVFPDNGSLGVAAVQGVYALQSGKTGETLAVIDGTQLTRWRTAAASALAARILSRDDARRLLIVGAGALAPFLARAHASVRPIESVEIWNHRPEGARRIAAALAQYGVNAKASDNLEDAARKADVICCATLSREPLISGSWLRPGQHVDLVGAFNMEMREVDDAAIRCARVFVDTPAALTEGGDIAQALRSGAITTSAILGDLAALVKGAPGRVSPHEITLFKSVGAAIEDLAAAILVYERLQGL